MKMVKKLKSRSRAVLNKQLKAFLPHRRKITNYPAKEGLRLFGRIPAYHEAGHAAIALACDMPVKEIIIEKDEIRGHTVVGTPIWSIMENKTKRYCQKRPEFRSYIMQSLAGAVAVDRFLGVNATRVAEDDFEDICKILMRYLMTWRRKRWLNIFKAAWKKHLPC